MEDRMHRFVEYKERPEGSLLVMIVSIIMIVMGVISVVGVVPSMILAVALKEFLGGVGYVLIFIAVLSMMSVVFELVCGILGVIHSKRREKAKLLITFAVIDIVLTVASAIGTVIFAAGMYRAIGLDNPTNEATILSLVISLVCPVLLIIGANKVRNS